MHAETVLPLAQRRQDAMADPPLHPKVRIGHVHLKVADLQRATDFYRDVLGFDIVLYGPEEVGVQAAWLSAGGYHHHVALNTFESEGATPPPPGHPGLYHFALLYPDRLELAKAVKRVLDHGHALSGTQDDGASVSVFLSDPDGNGIELYYDRPKERWTDERGKPFFAWPRRFDPEDLLDELGSA
jgi:catechol 2,3-dioxygenase